MMKIIIGEEGVDSGWWIVERLFIGTGRRPYVAGVIAFSTHHCPGEAVTFIRLCDVLYHYRIERENFMIGLYWLIWADCPIHERRLVMKSYAHPQPSEEHFSETSLIARSLILLSTLTGFLYIRVFVAAGHSLFGSDGHEIDLLMSVLIGFAICGLIIAWRWEGLGGFMALVSGLILTVLVTVLSVKLSWLTGFFYGSPFIITGGLCLFSWWRKR